MPRPHRTAHAHPARFRPALLRLEDRTAPALLTVTNLSDHDPGSLRAQVGAAAASGDTIQFQAGLTGTITLTTGEVLLDKNLTITGPGVASLLSVSGNHVSRVFEVAANKSVTISYLTVADGAGVVVPVTGGTSNSGGGIYLNTGAFLLLDLCVVSGCSARITPAAFMTGTASGGGIYVSAGAYLDVHLSTISGCSATVQGMSTSNAGKAYGGGIYSASSMLLTSSTLSNNTASASGRGGSGNGGGLYGTGTATVIDCTFSGNQAFGQGYGTFTMSTPGSGAGGAIAATAGLTVLSSILTGNTAHGVSDLSNGGRGGAIDCDTLTLSDCAITDNVASGYPGRYNEGAFGGGVSCNGGTVTNCAFVGNSVFGNDGGGGLGQGTGTLAVSGCTFSANSTYFYQGLHAPLSHSQGGGIRSHGTLSLTNSTLIANTSGGFGSDPAGHALVAEGMLTITYCTITANGTHGAALYATGSTAGHPQRLTNTIVAANPGGNIVTGPGMSLDPASSYNLIGTGGAGGLVNGVNHNLVGVANPGLGTLGFYGGTTQTVPLLPGSPAIAAADFASGPNHDQRDYLRNPVHPSIGAFEDGASIAAYFEISAPATVIAGSAFAVTVTARDAYGDVVADFTGPVLLGSTDPQAAADLGFYTFDGSEGGSHTFSGVTLYTAPTQTLLASTHNFRSGAGVTVLPAAPAFLYLVVDPSVYRGLPAGSAFAVTAVLYDAYGNRATNFTGTLHFASTDPAAGLPVDYAFTATDAGSHAFTLTLNTPGPVTVTASVVGSAGVSFDLGLYVG